MSSSNIRVKTGGHIDSMVMALVKGANDGNGGVKSAVFESLVEIGRKEPNLVTSSCAHFLLNQPKSSTGHRIALLRTIFAVLQDRLAEINEDLGHALIDLGLKEMLAEKEPIKDWQSTASKVVVGLGLRFPDMILDRLMEMFPSGTLPHIFIVQTLGDLAVANSKDVVPRLKDIFARVLPVLGTIKARDKYQGVFAAGIGHFCEAILSYRANLDPNRNDDNSITEETFSSEVFTAYDFMFTNWLGTKSKKVRLASMQCIGTICALMNKEQFETQLPRIIPVVLNFYKKESTADHLPITQGLCTILEVAAKDPDSEVLDPLLQLIFNTIHPLACMPVNMSDSKSIKNHNELLRCFEIIGIAEIDTLLTFLLSRVVHKEPKLREGTVEIFKHLINRIKDVLETRKELIVGGLKPVVKTESNNNVKRALSQTIVAMASHDYLSKEGGERLLEFILENSAKEDAPKVPPGGKKNRKKTVVSSSDISDRDIRRMCDNTLNLMATTIPCMENVLFPYLLEPLVRPEYLGSIAVICKALAYLGDKKRREDSADYIIDFDRNVNLPKPQAIIARLVVCLNVPLRRNGLGLHVLECLKALGPILHPSVFDMWDTTIPKLIKYYEERKQDWKASNWEDLVLRLLSETIKIINDDEWTMQIGEAILEQMTEFKADHELKKTSLKHLGLILQQINHKEFIKSTLLRMFQETIHTNDLQRVGCAQGFGYCANTHLDMTLEKLEECFKVKSVKAPSEKKGGFFSRLFSGNDSGKAKGAVGSANTIVLCYGYITAYANTQTVTSRVDVHIINNLKTRMETNDVSLRENIIKAIDLIGKAMHPSHLKKKYKLKTRNDLLFQVLNYLNGITAGDKKKGKQVSANLITSQIRVLGINAVSTLVNLDPAISVEIETQIVESVKGTFDLDPEGEEEIERFELMLSNLQKLFATIVFKDTAIDRLHRLLTAIGTFHAHLEQSRRLRSMNAMLFLIKKYIKYAQEKEKVPDRQFENLAPVLARLVPRATDPEPKIRRVALEGIQLLLYVDYALRESVEKDLAIKEVKPPAPLSKLTEFKKTITQTEERNEHDAIMQSVSSILSEVLREPELSPFLLAILDGLVDAQPSSSRGTCIVLYGVLKGRGKEAEKEVPPLVNGILDRMRQLSNQDTLKGTFHALKTLAAHHTIATIDALLLQNIPHDEHTVKALQVLAKDSELVQALIDHLTDVITNGELFEMPESGVENKKGGGKKGEPTQLSQGATCGLAEIMRADEISKVFLDRYAMFFGTFCLRFGTTSGFVEPSKYAVEALKEFFVCCGEEEILENMESEGLWGKLEGDEYLDAITRVVDLLCSHHGEKKMEVFEFLLPYLKANYVGQRLVTATVFAELVNHCKGDAVLLGKVYNCLLSALVDSSLIIQCLRGISNIVSCSEEAIAEYASTALDALMSSAADSNDTIAMEAMRGLAKIFPVVPEEKIHRLLINVCNRIRPAFDKRLNLIREASVRLFGALSRFGDGLAKETFFEQLHNNLPSILVHLKDDEKIVCEACKLSLKELSGLFRDEEISEVLNGRHLEEGYDIDFEDFCNSLSKALIAKYPERINGYVMTLVEHYFKSTWSSVRAAAATLVGFLLGNFPIDLRKGMNMNPGFVCSEMVVLLKEKSPLVREKNC